MKQYYMPAKALEKLIWLQNFANKIAGYATKYGIAEASVTDIQNGYEYIAYWMNYRNQYQEYLKKLSKFKDELMGTLGAASVAPAPPTFAAPTTSVAAGIFPRVKSVVDFMKINIA